MKKEYLATFRTDRGYAIKQIEAEGETEALFFAKSNAIGKLQFETYFEPGPIQEINIFADDKLGEFLVGWKSDELRLRHAAPGLLEAAKDVVAHWDKGDLAGAVRRLAAAIREAEGA